MTELSDAPLGLPQVGYSHLRGKSSVQSNYVQQYICERGSELRQEMALMRAYSRLSPALFQTGI